ncbi:hypothetical protein LTR28_005244, partial [Elasticomyces elasticus]
MLRGPLARSSSLTHPEFFDSAKHASDLKYETEAQNYHQVPDYGENKEVVQEEMKQKQPKRYCGIRRPVFIWSLAALVLIVVIAAVLGGVLPTVLNKASHSASPSSNPPNATSSTTPSNGTGSPNPRVQAVSNSGLATMAVHDAQTLILYSYYQNPNGTIMESRYANGSGIGVNSTHTDTSVIAIVTDAAQRSPLAAVSYTIQGVIF